MVLQGNVTTVLELYNENLSDDIAKKENAYAEAAFVAGIPTAISYEEGTRF
jgi:hypothetical protein